MAYEPKNGSGALFRNDKQNDRQPDWRGDITIDGARHRLSAWIRKSANGKEFLSLSAEGWEKVEERQEEKATPAPRKEAPKAAPSDVKEVLGNVPDDLPL